MRTPATARIARTVSIVAVCRTFVQSVLTMVYRPHMDHYRPQSRVPTAGRLHENLPFCRSFSSPLLVAVGAGDTFARLPLPNIVYRAYDGQMQYTDGVHLEQVL